MLFSLGLSGLFALFSRKKKRSVFRKGTFFTIFLMWTIWRSGQPVEAYPIQWAEQGNYYDFIYSDQDWWSAKDAAEQVSFLGISGHLVTITSDAENMFLNMSFNTNQANSFAWAGGYEPADDGNWFWAVGPEQGSAFSYANWGGIEPNDDKDQEDYLMVNLGTEFRGIHLGEWADASPWPSTDDPVIGYLVEFDTCPPALEIIVAKTIEIGGTTVASATPSNYNITWSIVKRIPDDGTILADIDASGAITVRERSGPGKLTIQAKYSDYPTCPEAEAEIEITCAACTGGVCPVPGSGGPAMGSIETVFHLGRTVQGKSAGRLLIQSKTMTPDLATPAGLYYDHASEVVEVITTSEGVLRQVFAPQTLADIVVITAFKYDIRFYAPEDAGTKNAEGVYEPTGTPFVVWTIENPDASAETYNRLRVTKTAGTAVTVNEYRWDAASQTWSLTTGNGLRTETKQTVWLSSTEQAETRTISDPINGVASETVATYRTFPWGKDIVAEVVDPYGANLVTTPTYYENEADPGSYGRIHTVTNPDGSQVEYAYNPDGTLQHQRETWKDTPNGKVTLYDYTPVDSQDDGSVRPRAARTITEQVEGVTIAKTYRAYFGDTEIVEQAVTPDVAYGDPQNQRVITEYYPETGPEVEAGKLKQVSASEGRITTYTYEQGTLTIGALTDPDQYLFTPGAGTARRTIVTQGPETSGKTTREVSLFDERGFQVFSATEVYTGSGYERVRWTIQEFNRFGQVVQTYHSDGTVTNAQWGCCGKTYAQDGSGIEQYFAYNALNWLETTTKVGVPNIITTFGYDAIGRRLSETTTAGALQSASRSAYDGAGRLIAQTDAADRTTYYDYTDGERTTTVTRPGGATEITTRYRDGRVKSITGTGVVAQYYDYGVNADGAQWTIVYTGPAGTGSPVWVKTTTDLLGQTIREERPGYGGVVLTTTMHYNSQGQLVRIETSGQAASGSSRGSCGRPCRHCPPCTTARRAPQRPPPPMLWRPWWPTQSRTPPPAGARSGRGAWSAGLALHG